MVIQLFLRVLHEVLGTWWVLIVYHLYATFIKNLHLKPKLGFNFLNTLFLLISRIKITETF